MHGAAEPPSEKFGCAMYLAPPLSLFHIFYKFKDFFTIQMLQSVNDKGREGLIPMILRILKKDMRRRKSVNFILFLFITLASVFLSSSINNILVIFPAVEYYIDYANVPDVTYVAMGTDEKEEVDGWVANDAPKIKGHESDTMLALSNKGVRIEKNQKKDLFDSNSASIYVATQDSSYCKVFDTNGDSIVVNSGEIAVSISSAQRNGLKLGEQITVEQGEISKTFTLRYMVKDATFGSDMVGMIRMIISPEDYALFSEADEANLVSMYYFDTTDVKGFLQELNNQGFTSGINSITKDTYAMAYSFDMIVAALLILIGICLILIALLVLRFTLVFTLEEEYREIGIMKAVGLRGFAVKKLYLVKYFVLVTGGAILGLAASVPVSKAMVKGVSQNMIMKDAGGNLGINVICAILLVILVMLFCYGCTRKLDKVSAITAIRSGQTGERFGRRGGIDLYKRKRMAVPVFLGLNDMLSHTKRYVVLIITFCISFILITIPLNTLNTMQSREMVTKFAIDPDSAVYVNEIEAPGETVYKSTKQLELAMNRIEKELEEKGYETKLTAIPIFFLQFSENGTSDNRNIMTIQAMGPNQDYWTYSEGVAPELINEIAFSEKVMEFYEWQVGDTIETTLNGDEKRFLITGMYSDYMQLGSNARLNPKIDMEEVQMFGYWNVMVDMDGDMNQTELAEELNRELPAYNWADAQDVVDRNVGGIQDSLKRMMMPMTIMLCAIIMLITFLMQRLFIVREKGEVAMMKSMGFKNNSIRIWQTIRMLLAALISMVVAIPVSLLSNQLVLKPIFSVMGADVEIQVVAWKVYGVYPGFLLVGIILATLLATLSVKKINIRELNNLE